MGDSMNQIFARRPLNSNIIHISSDEGMSYHFSVQDFENMLVTNQKIKLWRNGTPVPLAGGNVYLAKSGKTVYAKIGFTKFRFPYSRFVGLLCIPGAFAVGDLCDGSC